MKHLHILRFHTNLPLHKEGPVVFEVSSKVLPKAPRPADAIFTIPIAMKTSDLKQESTVA